MISGSPIQSDFGPPNRRRTLGRALPDVAFLTLLALAWWVYVGPIVMTEHRIGSDIFRDVATVVNIQHGRLFADPGYVGETFWYPPLNPLIVAGVSSVFHISPTDCYRWSQLVFNWAIPFGLFLLVRRAWSFRSAAVATTALLLAMPWWQTEVAHGQPSIHALVWGMVSLWLYARQEQTGSARRALTCGLFQGVSFWHHPFVPAVLAVAFLLQACAAFVQRGRWTIRDAWKDAGLRRTVLILVVTLAVAGPALYQMLSGPVLNPIPREYVAREYGMKSFALMRGNLWLWATGVIGVIHCVRRGGLACRILVSILAVTLIAQVPGYVRLYGGDWARGWPTFVPHEFQRLFQFAWAAAIGVGVNLIANACETLWCSWRSSSHDRLGDAGTTTSSSDESGGAGVNHASDRRLIATTSRKWIAAGLTLLACVVTGAWGVPGAPENLRRYIKPFPIPEPLKKAEQWILANTDINDVFACDANLAFLWLNAGTGRKVWILPRGHSNPRVDWTDRRRTLEAMRTAPTPEALWHIVREHGIDFIIPSAEWTPIVMQHQGELDDAFAVYFQRVYGGPGAVTIYKPASNP